MQLGQAQSILYFFPDQTGNEPFILENGTKNPNSNVILDFLPFDSVLNQTYLRDSQNFEIVGSNNNLHIGNDVSSGGAFNSYINFNNFPYVSLGIAGGSTYIEFYQIAPFDDFFQFGVTYGGVLYNQTLPAKSGTLQIEEYTEAFGAQVVNTIINTWQSIVLTGAPANSICDVLVTNASAGVAYNAGVRAVGSSLARIVSTTGSNSCCVTVKTDASGQAEFYSGNLANISFRYLGVHGK